MKRRQFVKHGTVASSTAAVLGLVSCDNGATIEGSGGAGPHGSFKIHIEGDEAQEASEEAESQGAEQTENDDGTTTVSNPGDTDITVTVGGVDITIPPGGEVTVTPD